MCWIPSADRSLRSVLFYVEPAWGRLCSAMFFKLDVSLSSLLTPTFYLSLRFWTGRGLYLHYGTSNHCIRDFIAFSNLNKICVMRQEYWGLKGIEYRVRYMQCLPLIYYASKIREENKWGRDDSAFGYPVANYISSKTELLYIVFEFSGGWSASRLF